MIIIVMFIIGSSSSSSISISISIRVMNSSSFSSQALTNVVIIIPTLILTIHSIRYMYSHSCMLLYVHTDTQGAIEHGK